MSSEETNPYNYSFLNIINIFFIIMIGLDVLFTLALSPLGAIFSIVLFVGYIKIMNESKILYNDGNRGSAYFTSVSLFLLFVFLNFFICLGGNLMVNKIFH